MTLLDKIRLSRKFGRTTYVISAILTVPMAVLVVFYPMMVSAFICIKIISALIIFYLRSILESGFRMYFYINLGISRREYLFIPAVVEFVAFMVLIVVSSITGHAIG